MFMLNNSAKFIKSFISVVILVTVLIYVFLTLILYVSVVYANDQFTMIFTNARVIDGDTVAVNMNNLPPPLNKVSIRALGVDTPELRGKCHQEKELAEKAKLFTTKLVKNKTIKVVDYGYDKYGGRIVGRILIENSKGIDQDLSVLLVDAKLAVKYLGFGQKKNWCE